MPESIKDIFLGIFILFLAFIMWRVEKNFWAWLVLFIPGSFYVVWGIIKAIKDR
jgi:membrane-bound ClpP family serine protease